ncbi:tudor domain protein [Necator americanus]|uniref:Tudor domain protein n=1 Tax=Necator americanus TaxID=51031 RepID=W2T2V8_NECAM|nr:tudor domain protein [Necator americanus]ETN76243.1 tudor domain protein [Necator americanus]
MDQVCFPSGSGDVEKGFCVKNIPLGFKEWELFHVFRKYGIVHNVKIPTKQNYPNSKYGFVVMEDFNGADQVRYQLKNGRFLALENGVQLQVSSVHHGEQQRDRSDATEVGTRVPFKDLQCSVPSACNKRNGSDKNTGQKTHQSSISVRCFSQDLPLQIPVKVRVVDSPFPCKSSEEDFVFHVIPIDQKLSDEYIALQREMNKYCQMNPNLQELPKIGEYALYGRTAIAYRALRNSEKTMYLVDTGETVPINLSLLWEISPFFARLPSLVIPCGIAGITWKNPSVAMFNKCRNALSQWSRSYPAGLRATACGFSRLRNLVDLVAVSGDVVDDFATCIAAKGMCTQLSQKRFAYSRESVLDAKNFLKDKDISPSINYSENIAEIISGVQTVAVA